MFPLRFMVLLFVHCISCLLVLIAQVDCNATCPQKCMNTCTFDSQGEITEAQCRDVFIQSLPNTLTILRLYDAVDPSTLPMQALMNFAFSGKSNLTFLKIENYGIATLMGDTFQPCQNLESLDLSKNDLRQVEEENFSGLSKLQYLNLNYNQLNSIGNFTFRKLPQLEALHVAFNHIQEISELNFAGLQNIKNIDLRSSQIRSIHRNAINFLTTLEEIILFNNSLTAIAANLFSNLPYLRIINLQSNLIHTIEHQQMASRSLVMVNFGQNEITAIPTGFLQNISSSKVTVNLAGNSIASLPANVLNGVTLEVLFLSSNNISTIDKDALNNSFIEKFDIQQNFLQHIPEGVQKHLNQSNVLLLSNNPWSCDCSIQWVRVLLRTDVPEPTCTEPRSYFGNRLSDVLNDLKVSCNGQQVPLPAPSKALPIPPRQNPVTPRLNKVTTSTTPYTPPLSRHQTTVPSNTTSTIKQTVQATTGSKGGNSTVIIVGVVVGVAVLATLLTVMLKKYMTKSPRVVPDPLMTIPRCEINHKQYLKYIPAQTRAYEI